MQFNSRLGERIRARRERLGLRQADLAAALGLTAAAVSKWERGETAPDIGSLVPLAGLLGVTVDHLLAGEWRQEGTFEATVLVTGAAGFTALGDRVSPAELAAAIRTMHFHVTEAALSTDGVPMKYAGDAFIALFTGAERDVRAVSAALRAASFAGEVTVGVGVAAGSVHVGEVGHPDYATRDVLGDVVNLAFRIQGWLGGEAESARVGTCLLDPAVEEAFDCEEHADVTLKGLSGARRVVVVRGRR